MSSPLADRHYAELAKGSGISHEVIKARGAYTAYSPGELEALGYKGDQLRVPALVLPEHLLNGWQPTFHIKPDSPRVDKVRPDGTVKYRKYDRPFGSANRLDVPPTVRDKVLDPDEPLIFTEGWKKADAAASHGMAVVALGGVWNFAGSTEDGWMAPLEDFRHIPLKKKKEQGRRVLIVFDSDVRVNEDVRNARERFYHLLMGYGARVQYVDFEPLPDGSKCGLDDFLLTHTPADVWALAYDPQEEKFAAMQRKLDEVQKELSDAREEYRWQRDLDSVPNKLLSGADKLALRDLRRATKRAGDAAYREPQTLFYGERTRHTGQSKQTYGAAVKRAEEMGAVKIVKGNYESSGKPKISVVLCDAFKQPAQLARPEPSKAGGARPKNVPVCDGCGPDAGVREDKTTTTKYYCTGPDCGVLLHEVSTPAARVHLVRDPSFPEDCYPPEAATVPYLERKVEETILPSQPYPVRSKYGTVPEPPEYEPGYLESLVGTAPPPATTDNHPQVPREAS